MSWKDTLRGLVMKKPENSAIDYQDPRRASGKIAGGRREGESENPYLSARRTWNHHVGSVVAERRTWQVIGILSMLIALASIGGVIHIGQQSKFMPYVIEVDKLGQAVAVGPIAPAGKTDQRSAIAAVAGFITDSRTVTPDVALQRKAVFKVYAMLSANEPATQKMNEWLNGNPDASPFKRAEKEMVSVEIKSVLPQTPDTYQVDWEETTRDRQGVLSAKPTVWRALVTVYTAEITPQTSEEQMRNNPLSIYARDFSWSRLN